MTRDEIRQRALQATQILDNEVFQEVFESLKQNYIRQWENSTDTETRELCFFKVKAIQDVQKELIRNLNAYKIIEG